MNILTALFAPTGARMAVIAYQVAGCEVESFADALRLAQEAADRSGRVVAVRQGGIIRAEAYPHEREPLVFKLDPL